MSKRKPKYQEAFETEYPYVGGAEQKLRAFVFDGLSNGGGAADIDGRILIDNMQKVFEWIMTGAVPLPTNARHKPIGKVSA